MNRARPDCRVGWGIDAHRFGAGAAVLLAGVEVDRSRGVEATSDGDVVAHAVIDALLGAAVLGDIGLHFPSSDPRFRDADSMELLASTVERVREADLQPTFCDVTVIAQTVRVSPYRHRIRRALAETLGLEVDRVSVKATTTDGMGWLGRDEGIAATALASVSG